MKPETPFLRLPCGHVLPSLAARVTRKRHDWHRTIAVLLLVAYVALIAASAISCERYLKARNDSAKLQTAK